MRMMSRWIGCLAVIVWLSGCAVMSREIQERAFPYQSFRELITDADQYRGQTVIVGGYIVSVENHKDRSRVVAVQTSLGLGQEPQSKDLSKGRLILVYKGFLDPEVYSKDRRITVGGEILSSSAHDPKADFPYLEIAVEEIHLWPVKKPEPDYPYWYYDPWYPYPWGWWRHPYW